MKRWTLKSYVTSRGTTAVEEWASIQSLGVTMALQTFLKFLIEQPPNVWKRPYVSVLSGGKRSRATGCAGLVELRFDYANVEHRPIGRFSGRMEFTVLAFAIEKGSAFEPKGICEIAKRRQLEIDNNQELAREFNP